MRVFTYNLTVAGVAALLFGAPVAAADPTPSDWTEALHFLGRLNRPDPLEPAGSRGSMGVGVAAGASTYAPPPDNAALKAELGSSATQSTYAVPRVWLDKGLPLPVDLGITASAEPGAPFTQVSGHVQWTVYEALAMPSVAVRASYGRLFGLSGMSLASTSGDAVASYGFLRYFNIFGSLGATQHHGSYTLKDQGPSGFMLADDTTGSPEVGLTWVETVRTAGLKIMVVPPFVSLVGEVNAADNGAKELAVKLGIGM
jgi:hypothetical protein